MYSFEAPGFCEGFGIKFPAFVFPGSRSERGQEMFQSKRPRNKSERRKIEILKTALEFGIPYLPVLTFWIWPSFE
jgi:hypothetical protein